MRSRLHLGNKGFGVIELAAWIVVTCFVVKVIAVTVIGAAILRADDKNLNLRGYNQIHLALR